MKYAKNPRIIEEHTFMAKKIVTKNTLQPSPTGSTTESRENVNYVLCSQFHTIAFHKKLTNFFSWFPLFVVNVNELYINIRLLLYKLPIRPEVTSNPPVKNDTIERSTKKISNCGLKLQTTASNACRIAHTTKLLRRPDLKINVKNCNNSKQFIKYYGRLYKFI